MSVSTCPVTGAKLTSPKPSASGCPFASMATVAGTQPRADPTLAIPEAYRHATLTEAQKALVRASVPALQAHGVPITKLFYDNMLAAHPGLHEIFNKANQVHLEQPKALANAVLAYAQNIDDLTPLAPAVELISGKHASLYVQPEQYAIVGKHLIEAIATVLGEAVTPELAEAWTKAYWMLAEILIKREDQMYKATNGWSDWRDFKIAKKVKESDEVTSFYLEPVDESMKPLPPFLPGQYISIQIDVPQLGHRQARQYSLSDQPHPNYYRISIKAERGENAATVGHAGLVSVLMHDSKHEGDLVRLSHPEGDFFLNSGLDADAPLVMISGGIGLTPLTSMLNTLVKDNSSRAISWVHGARHNRVRAFKDHIKGVADSNPKVQVALFNDAPEEDEVEGRDYHYRGHIDLNKFDKEKFLYLKDGRTQYYVCGPPRFMAHAEKELLAHGVSPTAIHMERFGTGGVPKE